MEKREWEEWKRRPLDEILDTPLFRFIGIYQCCCQGLTSRGQGQGQGLEVRGRGQGQGLKFQILKHLLNNDINFLE